MKTLSIPELMPDMKMVEEDDFIRKLEALKDVKDNLKLYSDIKEELEASISEYVKKNGSKTSDKTKKVFLDKFEVANETRTSVKALKGAENFLRLVKMNDCIATEIKTVILTKKVLEKFEAGVISKENFEKNFQVTENDIAKVKYL